FTGTGASSTTGLPLTSTSDQFRVNVTVLSRVRRWARVLAGVASSFVWSEAATRLSSTYDRPSWVTVGRFVPAQLVAESRNPMKTPARPLALIGGVILTTGTERPPLLPTPAHPAP